MVDRMERKPVDLTRVNDPDRLVLGEASLGRGESRRIPLEFARLPSGTVIDTIVHVARGPEPGPVLLLQGGLHGDEVGGVEVLRRVIATGGHVPKRGTVMVVPILNAFGFIHFSRDVPDGKDVNRSFPGHQRGSLASRIAWHLMHDLFVHVNVGIDFHTGGGRRENHPQVRYTPGDANAEQLAQAFAAPFRLPSKPIAKSFRKAALDRGVPIVVYEGGESLRFDEHAIEEGIAGARRVMAHLGMVDAEAPPTTPCIALEKSRWIRAPRAGLFHATVPNGVRVEAGAHLGVLAEIHGGRERDLRAPSDGWIIAVNRLPVVNQGDALIHLGQ